MKYLLDTHIILWIAFNDNKLSRKTKDIFTDKANDIYISSISLWEISIKYFSGKLDLKDYTPETIMAGFDLYFDYQKLDLAFDDAMTFHQLQLAHHKDPFDRMLIWQALQHNLTLITDDENIRKYKDIGLKVIW